MLLLIEKLAILSWPFFFVLVSGFSFVLAVSIYKRERSLKGNWPIVALLLGFALILVQYVMFWTDNRTTYPYVYFFDTSFILLFGPLIYVYVLKLFHQSIKFSRLHYLPAFTLFTLDLIFLVLTDGFTNTEAFKDNSFYIVLWQMKSPWVGIISLFLYYLLTKETILQSSIMTKNGSQNGAFHFRNTWSGYILKFFLAFLLAYGSYYVLVKFQFFNPNWDYAISIVMSLGICGIGYMAFKEQQIFNGELLSDLFLNKKPCDLSNTTKTELFQKLKTHITEKKPYLNGNLRLVDLADQLNFQPHILSQIINEKAHKNFNQFINEYRLDEAIELLKHNKNESIKSICYQVGFNNKTTFYKTFKKRYGCTPNEYKLNNAF